MRIVAGKYANRKLRKVRGSIRPTGVRLRTAFFDALGDKVKGSRWLDAFAGTGAVGIEALSRGAHLVVFNDRDPQALRAVHQNLQICQIEQGFQITRFDVFVLMRKLPTEGPFDIVFLDPPYRFGRHQKLLERLALSPLVGDGTLVALEAFKKTEFQIPDGLTPLRRFSAGDDVLNLYRAGSP